MERLYYFIIFYLFLNSANLQNNELEVQTAKKRFFHAETKKL